MIDAFSHFHRLTRSVTNAALKATALGLKATTTRQSAEATQENRARRSVVQDLSEVKLANTKHATPDGSMR